MTYSSGHPVRLIGGRLALDFFNTADWSEQGTVAHEKVEQLDDIDVWRSALGLAQAGLPEDVREFRDYRRSLREAWRKQPDTVAQLVYSQFRLSSDTPLQEKPLLDLISISALSILSDPRELRRIKTCPGANCGWMFIDETQNGRRKWCMMETCGNRAKAARHYEKTIQVKSQRQS